MKFNNSLPRIRVICIRFKIFLKLCNFWTRKVCKFRTSWFLLRVVKTQDCSDFCPGAGLGKVRRNCQNCNITSEVVTRDLGLLLMLLGACVQAWTETGFKEESVLPRRDCCSLHPTDSQQPPVWLSKVLVSSKQALAILYCPCNLMHCRAGSFACALVEITTFK